MRRMGRIHIFITVQGVMEQFILFFAFRLSEEEREPEARRTSYNLILDQICSTLKKVQKAIFSSGKEPQRIGTERKISFRHGIGHNHGRTQQVRDWQ